MPSLVPQNLTATVTAVFGSYAPVSTDAVVLADPSNNDITITLPAAAANIGRQIAVKGTGNPATATQYSRHVYMRPTLGDLIEGGHGFELMHGGATLISDGTAWWLISDSSSVPNNLP